MCVDVPITISADSVNRIPEGSSQSAELETIISSSQADQLSSTFFVGKNGRSTFMDLTVS